MVPHLGVMVVVRCGGGAVLRSNGGGEVWWWRWCSVEEWSGGVQC